MNVQKHIGFLIFLPIYGYLKFAVAPAMMAQPGYMMTTALLVIMTAVIPYFLSWFLVQKIEGYARYGAALVLPLVLGAAGLATYYFLIIVPMETPLTLAKVLPRSITPGVVLGLILLASTFLHREK